MQLPNQGMMTAATNKTIASPILILKYRKYGQICRITRFELAGLAVKHVKSAR